MISPTAPGPCPGKPPAVQHRRRPHRLAHWNSIVNETTWEVTSSTEEDTDLSDSFPFFCAFFLFGVGILHSMENATQLVQGTPKLAASQRTWAYQSASREWVSMGTGCEASYLATVTGLCRAHPQVSRWTEVPRW